MGKAYTAQYKVVLKANVYYSKGYSTKQQGKDVQVNMRGQAQASRSSENHMNMLFSLDVNERDTYKISVTMAASVAVL